MYFFLHGLFKFLCSISDILDTAKGFSFRLRQADALSLAANVGDASLESKGFFSEKKLGLPNLLC